MAIPQHPQTLHALRVDPQTVALPAAVHACPQVAGHAVAGVRRLGADGVAARGQRYVRGEEWNAGWLMGPVSCAASTG